MWATRPVPLAFLLLVVVVVVQIAMGAYRSERGLYSDESAHFMNGLLLRDYIWHGLGQNPMTFAQDYYQHYPKIAPLMWPPLFHALLGVFLLPGWPPLPAAMALLAAFTAWTAWRLCTMAASMSSVPTAVGAVVAFLLTPAVISLGTSVMVDIVIAALAIESAYWLARYFESEQPRDGARFGLVAALGCLAKGNGISIVLMPAFMVVLTGRYAILRRSGLYIAASIVVALAVPFLATAYRMDAALGDFGPLTGPLMAERTAFYAQHIWAQAGPVVLLFAAIGGVAAMRGQSVFTDETARAQGRALLSLVGGAIVFHVCSPHTLSHWRYITLIFAPLLALASAGATVLGQFISSRALRVWLPLAVFLLIIVGRFATGSVGAAQAPLGYRAVVRSLQQDDALAGRTTLVVSNEQGEGAYVVEVAAASVAPKPTVLRGSKWLATDDWMGRGLTLHFDSPDSVLTALDGAHVDYVLLDGAPEARRLLYWTQVSSTIEQHPERFIPIYRATVNAVTGPLRPLTLYRIHPVGVASNGH